MNYKIQIIVPVLAIMMQTNLYAMQDYVEAALLSRCWDETRNPQAAKFDHIPDAVKEKISPELLQSLPSRAERLLAKYPCSYCSSAVLCFGSCMIDLYATCKCDEGLLQIGSEEERKAS